MVLISNLVEILISGVFRPHGLLVTLYCISVISWPLIDHILFAHFRTNLVEIFIRGSTDLIDFWLHFIEFPSCPGLWLGIHFPSIFDKLLELSRGIPQIWLRFGHTSLSSHLLLIVWALAAHFWTKCSWVFVKIFIRVFNIFDYLLVMLYCIFSASWPITFCAFLDKLLDRNMRPHMPRLYQI